VPVPRRVVLERAVRCVAALAVAATLIGSALAGLLAAETRGVGTQRHPHPIHARITGSGIPTGYPKPRTPDDQPKTPAIGH
jgi:hypothetical protein